MSMSDIINSPFAWVVVCSVVFCLISVISSLHLSTDPFSSINNLLISSSLPRYGDLRLEIKTGSCESESDWDWSALLRFQASGRKLYISSESESDTTYIRGEVRAGWVLGPAWLSCQAVFFKLMNGLGTWSGTSNMIFPNVDLMQHHTKTSEIG